MPSINRFDKRVLWSGNADTVCRMLTPARRAISSSLNFNLISLQARFGGRHRSGELSVTGTVGTWFARRSGWFSFHYSRSHIVLLKRRSPSWEHAFSSPHLRLEHFYRVAAGRVARVKNSEDSAMSDVFGATSTTDQVLQGVNLRRKW